MLDLISILLIDDDEDDFLITQDLIDDIPQQRYRIDWASSYEEGWERIQQQSYDVYLVDYRLGAHTGLDLIEAAKEQALSRPIILLTGQGDFETDARAMQLGAADYLVKNQLSADKLERSIRYAIQQAKNLHEIRTLNAELEERVERRTQALRQAVADLRQSQQLFHSIAQNFPNGAIMVLDQQLNFVFVQGTELLRIGLNGAEMLGKSIFSIFPPKEEEQLKQNLGTVLEGEPTSFEIPFQQSIYSMKGVPLLDPHSQIEQVLLVANNITREKKAEEEIRNALEKEKQLSELKSRFVSMASHEFRTPLGTILSSASLLARYDQTEQQPKRIKHIQRIKSSVTNLTTILEDFLSITRLEEGSIKLRLEEFLLKPFFEEVISDVKGLLKPDQRIELEGQDGLEVCLDKFFLRNILNNLLSNAIKYSHEGTLIRVRILEHFEELQFEVIDQGIGIPEDEQHHLFERFFRAKNATNIQGTGLGLNILKKYVDHLGGQVHLESQINQGTTFKVCCPLRLEASESDVEVTLK